jgi:heme/copper-type cytochrome/quinol oxidase subunit 2
MEETQPTSGGSKMPMIVVGVVLILAILGFAGMKVLHKSTQPVVDQAMDNHKMTVDATMAPSAAVSASPSSAVKAAEKVITMDAGSFYYSVKSIAVKKGQKVKITMTSKDMMHDFNIDELNVHMPTTKAGETNTIEFTADKAGTFEYYCSVGQHRKMGQVGKITVTE